MKINFRLDKKESSAKNRNAGGVHIKLKAAFAIVTKTAYDHGDGSD